MSLGYGGSVSGGCAGVFDATVGPAIADCWGFDDSSSSHPNPAHVPEFFLGDSGEGLYNRPEWPGRESVVDSTSQLDECLQQALAGDQAALQQLLVAYCPVLSQQITKELPASVQPAISVEDVLQETLILAVRDFDSLRTPSRDLFAAWLIAIAEHRIQDTVKMAGRQKRRAARPPSKSPDDHAADSSILDLVQLVFDGGESPSQRAASAEAVHAIQVGVASLPDDQREAIRLRYLQGLSTQAAADQMERTPGAVRGLVSRARQNLRTVLGNSSRWFHRK